MISGVLTSASASASPQALSSLLSKPRSSIFFSASSSSSASVHTDLKLKSVGFYGRIGSQRSRLDCSANPGGPGFGEGDSRSVLDAFFLGKALAEAINDRIESGVGEFLSTIGRLQAEQQKLVEEFQEDVLERAKKAKEKAAREAMEAQGIVKSTTESITPVTTTNGVTAVSSTTTTTVVTPVNQSSLSEPAPSTTNDEQDPGDDDTVLGVPIDD